MAITPFKVSQSHLFWYYSKACMRLTLSYLLSCTVSKLWSIIGQIFDSDRVLQLTPSLGVIPCEYPDNFTSPETRILFLPDAEIRTIVAYLHSSVQNTGIASNSDAL